MGYGWTHTYDRHLSFFEGKIIAHREDGRAVVFSEDLVPESGAKEKLILNSGFYTLIPPDQIRETYNSSGNLIQIHDLNFNTLTLSYQEGKLITVTDPFGCILSFFYHPSGLLASVTDPSGNPVLYQYDGDNNLIQVVYPDGGVRQYTYDIHNLTGIIDNNVFFATYAYDQDRVILSTHADNANRIDLVYDNRETRVTDSRGNVTVYTWKIIQGIAVIESIIGCSACGNIDTTYAYDESLNLLGKTDGNGTITQYSDYDSWGNAGTVIEAIGLSEERTITRTHDPGFNKITTIIEPGHKITTFTYDEKGNLLDKTETAPARTFTYSYNTMGQVTRIDGPRMEDDITTFTYDQGNLASMTSLTSTTYTNYDPMGRVGTVTGPNKITTYTYDTRGRITKMDEGGAVSTYRYNLNGTLESTTTPLGGTTQYTYDNAQRLIEIIDHEGNRIVYTLNTEGNREQEDIYDSTTLVKTLSRTFDSHNLLESVIEPHGTTTFLYDLNKNLIQVIDARGNITTHNYDALNRLISVINPSPDGVSPSPQTSYEYDIQDNLIKIIDPNGLITNYLYDDLSNLLQTTSPDTGTTTNTHDPAGNLLTKTDSETTTYCYDALNRLTEVHFADSRDIYYTYDHGRLAGIIDSNVTYAYTYDPLGNCICY